MRRYHKPVKQFIAALCTAAMFVTMLPAPLPSAQAASVDASLLSGVSVLAANVYYKDSGNNAFTPYVIKEIKVGNKICKVGILGIENTDCSRFDVPDNYPNLVFAHPDNKKLSIAWEVDRYKEELKSKGCDAIIVSYHSGLGTADGNLVFEENTENQVARMIKETSGIDMVVAGHDHSTEYSNTYVENKDGKGVLVVNGGGQQLTQSIFTVKYENGRFVLGIKDSRNLNLANYADDMQLGNLIKPAVDEASAYVNQECGEIKGEKWSKSTNFYLEPTDSMDLINRAQMAVADKHLKLEGDNKVNVSATSVVVSNNYVVQPGKISLKDIYSLYKFDNYLYIVPLTGKELKTWMEGIAEDHFSYSFKNGKVKFSTVSDKSFTNPVFYGLNFSYDLAKEIGSRVVGLTFADGSEVKDEATYKVAVNSYHIGQAPFTRTGKTTEDAIWSSKDALGDDGGTVQALLAEFIKDSTNGSEQGVYPKPSNWALTYSGDIPADEGIEVEPTEVYDPITDKTIAEAGAVTVKEAADKTSGEGSVVGQVVYKYGKDASIILEDVVDGQIHGYQIYDKEKAGKFEVGDIVKVTGTFSENYGVPQMVYGSLEVLEDLGEEFAIAPQVVSVEDLGEDYMNEYVQIRNASIGKADGSYMEVKDSTGSIQIYAGAETTLAGSKDKADINAVCSYFSRSSLYQLRVGNESDYQQHVALVDPITDSMIAGGVSTIDKVKKAEPGDEVSVIGQVVYRYSGSNGAEGARNSIILQDVIGGQVEGLQIYAKDAYDKFAVGDVVEVTGKVSIYGGVTQVSPVDVKRVAVKTNFAPQEVTISQLGSDYLSEYVRIADCTLGSYQSSGNTQIEDTTGKVNIYKGASYPGDLDEADKADVLGICSVYNDTYQMRVGKSSDYVKKISSTPADEDSLLRIPVYETSDVHGSLVDTSSGNKATYQYRLAYLCNLVDEDRKDGDVLLLDGGDIYQGTPVSNLLYGQPMTAAYDDMKYDAVALGNHEFDWGVTTLIDKDGTMGEYDLEKDGVSFKGNSQIPVVCSNIYDAKTDARVDFTRDYTILEKTAKSNSGKEQKVRVAVLGYADDYSSDIMAEKIAPYRIKENVKTLEAKAKEIKQNENADAVVLLTHSGASGVAGSLTKGSAIDFVLGGHTHKELAGKADNGIAYAQPKNAAQSYVYGELCIDPNTKKVSVENHEVKSITAKKEVLYDTTENADKLDKEVVAISKVAIGKVEGTLNAELGKVNTAITKDLLPNSYSSIAGNWLADLQCRATASQVSFINNGGIRTTFEMPEGMNERIITKGDIYTIAPFNNQLYVYDVSYEQLKEIFEFAIESQESLSLRMSGATVYSTDGKITTILLNGEMIYHNGTWLKDSSTMLRVSTNNYVGTSSGTPFAALTPVETSAVDNESFITVLEQEAAEHDGVFAVNTEPTMIKGEYNEADRMIRVASANSLEDTAEFVVLTTTDMHGKCWNKNILTDAAVNNSFLRVSTAVQEIRKQYGKENVILIDNGDLFQGTQISSYNVAKGGINNPMAICLKYIGYDVLVLGNHEFNYSYSTMTAMYDFLQDGLPSTKPEEPGKPTPTPGQPEKPTISKASVAAIKDVAYTGKAITPSVTVKMDGKTLKNGVDYKLTYKNNVNPGTAQVVIEGIKNYKGTKTVTFKITKKSIAKMSVAKVKDQAYTGKEIKPSVTVKDGKTALRAGKDYSVSYKNNKYAGKATITITGKGNYAGTIKTSFVIIPKTPTIKKAKSYHKKMAYARWTKSNGATGYQVTYATKKNGSYKTAGTTKNSFASINGLKRKQTYYLKVRAYTVIDGKKVYSGYSAPQRVKTK